MNLNTCCSPEPHQVTLQMIDFLPLKNFTVAHLIQDEDLKVNLKKFRLRIGASCKELKLIILKSLRLADRSSRRNILFFELNSSTVDHDRRDEKFNNSNLINNLNNDVNKERNMNEMKLINYLKQYFVRPLIQDLEFLENVPSWILEEFNVEFKAKRLEFSWTSGNEFHLLVQKLSNDEELAHDRDYILKIVKEHPLIIAHCNVKWRSDREIMLESVKRNGLALKHASDDLRNDRELVLEAVKNDGSCLKYANSRFKTDQQVILQVAKTNEFALQHADRELLKDRDLMLQVVKSNGFCIKRIDKSLQSDREILIESIRQTPQCAKLWSTAHQSDPSLIEECVKINWKVLNYSPLKNDLQFLRRIFHDNLITLSHFDPFIDLDLIKELLKSKKCSFSDLGYQFYKSNPQIIDFAFEEDLFPPNEISLVRNNPERVLQLVMKDLTLFESTKFPPHQMLEIIQAHFESFFQLRLSQ